MLVCVLEYMFPRAAAALHCGKCERHRGWGIVCVLIAPPHAAAALHSHMWGGKCERHGCFSFTCFGYM